MASELRLVLIIIGALVLGGLFIHGIWTVRKNSKKTPHRFHPDAAESSESSTEGFDEYGIGSVRVVKGAGKAVAENRPKLQPAKTAPKPTSRPIDVRRPQEQSELFAEPLEPTLNFSAIDDASELPQDDLTYEEDARQGVETAPTSATDNTQESVAPSEVLILYVLLPEDRSINGPELLSALTVLGFKYGDMDIFHRHQDSAGTGAILFSLANMFNPGTFDIDSIDELNTRGLSLFMTLPGPGEPLQNFNLMNNAAKKLAEEFGGQVLDGQRSVLTVQTVRHYVERIREFQRQQLIRG